MRLTMSIIVARQNIAGTITQRLACVKLDCRHDLGEGVERALGASHEEDAAVDRRGAGERAHSVNPL